MAKISSVLSNKLPDWEILDFIPNETVQSAHPKWDPRRYGQYRWQDFFSQRQLLVHGTSVEIFRELLDEASDKELSEITAAAFCYLLIN